MNKFYTILSIALASFGANAADLYGQFPTPNSIKCTGAHNNVCTDTSRPDDIVVQYKDAYGQVTMQREPSFEIITCIGISDKCIDKDRNYRGKSVTGRDIKYVVFKDFYIYPGGDGTDWAYKNGTGPLFGGAVSSAPVAVSATASVKVTPDEACSSKWVDAFHKENGEDAMITSDQMDEWDQWCAKGKHPH